MTMDHVEQLMAMTKHRREPDQLMAPQSSVLFQIEKLALSEHVSDTVYAFIGELW